MPAPRNRLHRLARLAGLGALLAILVIGGASAFVAVRYRHRQVSSLEAPDAPVVLVFGAGLAAPGRPSAILAERLDAALALYHRGAVRKLLLSGDSRDRRHEETSAMRRYALERGVPEADVIEDHAGLSTYQSCLRARRAYGVERALLVTQSFHLPRALFLAHAVGIDAWGVAADEGAPRTVYVLRETLSRSAALFTALFPSLFGEPVPEAVAPPATEESS